MTTDELVKAFLAKGGQVGKCPPGRAFNLPAAMVPKHKGRHRTTLSELHDAWLTALQESDAPRESVEWWAAYIILPVDPYRVIAEAAGCYVIARDEGLESAALYRKELMKDPRKGV